jgi:hypothetical protein
MHLNFLLLAGIMGASINLVGFVPYLRDILRHKTKPERAMWWIYTVLFSVLLAAQAKAGARWLLLVSAEYILTSLAIAVLSIRYGYGTLHKRDLISIFLAILGLIIWKLTNSPLIAILIVICIDFAGFWLTLLKTWEAPHSETLISWQLALLSTIVSLFAIGSWSFTLFAYPLYAVVGDSLLVWIIIYRRRKLARDESDF